MSMVCQVQVLSLLQYTSKLFIKQNKVASKIRATTTSYNLLLKPPLLCKYPWRDSIQATVVNGMMT